MQVFTQFETGFTRCLRLSFVLLLLMIAAFFCYVWSEKQSDTANEKRYETRLLCDELRQTSDDLTRMIRSYVVTGDDAYRQRFEEIIAVRDGKRTRPAGYDINYWDFTAYESSAIPLVPNEAVSLLELMRQADFNSNELALLTKAKAKSDKLVEIERKAAELLQSADRSDQSLRLEALTMVFDDSYLRQKAEVMKIIDQAVSLSERRTQSDVDNATRWARLMRMALIVLGAALLGLILLCEKLFRSTLGAPPETVYQAIQWLGNGNFDSLPSATGLPKNSVMSRLAQTQKQFRELDHQRKHNHQSLMMMSKVFSEAQEGIFLTDAQGIVIDVNLAYLYITGYQRDQCLGRYSQVLASNQHNRDFYDQLWKQIEQEGHWRGEIWNHKKNGQLFASILNFSAVNDDQGHLLCYLGMLTDITQLKTHQQQMEELAFHDPLTSLPNRALLADRM